MEHSLTARPSPCGDRLTEPRETPSWNSAFVGLNFGSCHGKARGMGWGEGEQERGCWGCV